MGQASGQAVGKQWGRQQAGSGMGSRQAADKAAGRQWGTQQAGSGQTVGQTVGRQQAGSRAGLPTRSRGAGIPSSTAHSPVLRVAWPNPALPGKVPHWGLGSGSPQAGPTAVGLIQHVAHVPTDGLFASSGHFPGAALPPQSSLAQLGWAAWHMPIQASGRGFNSSSSSWLLFLIYRNIITREEMFHCPCCAAVPCAGLRAAAGTAGTSLWVPVPGYQSLGASPWVPAAG